MHRFIKILVRTVLILLAISLLSVWAFNRLTTLEAPEVVNSFDLNEKKVEVSHEVYTFQDSWLKKNEHGLWEMFIAGNPFEMGYKNGILTDSLNAYQELQFVNSIKEIIPSESYLNSLKYFLAWYNRSLNRYVPLEYRKEIYGVSLFASDDFNFIGESYPRMLNYHAAHDIGHALQNMNLVACTAFMVKGERSSDGSMMIGRNMDFSVGEGFAENKIVAFYRPEEGYNFSFITWAGMIGVVSGMNDQGLVVTLNAAKSSIPFSAKTPVSILARKVLQHASNISEALAIIQKAEVFVAESFLIGSAKDDKTVVIEKSIDETALYDTHSDTLILTNHYQSDELVNSKLNLESLEDGSSPYRMQRVAELLDEVVKHTPETFVHILRDQKGLDNTNIGMGNEKAVNQLIAHHSVIFKPKELQMWVAANPYQLGSYICYDLKAVFSDSLDFRKEISIFSNTIAEDDFLFSEDFKNFNEYKTLTSKFQKLLWDEKYDAILDEELARYETLNPNYFYTYYMLGECFAAKKEKTEALKYYERALQYEVSRSSEKEIIEKRIVNLKKDLRKDD